MTTVRQFDLNESSLPDGEYDDCEKTLTGDDADELRHARDGFRGMPCRRRSRLIPWRCPNPLLQTLCMGPSMVNFKISALYEVMIASLLTRARVFEGISKHQRTSAHNRIIISTKVSVSGERKLRRSVYHYPGMSTIYYTTYGQRSG